MLKIDNLTVETKGLKILDNLNFSSNAGEVHAIMGLNGSGKSTLLKTLVGDPNYEVISGKISYQVNFKEIDLLELDPDIRAKEGIFLSFQYPVEIPGVSNRVFLRTAFNSLCKHQGVDEMQEEEFNSFVIPKLDALKIPHSMLDRFINVGFSGGEKKRNEILQMSIFNPSLCLLDETDSGLDIDSMKIVAEGINKLKSESNSFILVTHYYRLLNYVKPDYVHILDKGKIIKSGDASLAEEVEKKGYSWLVKQ